MDEDDYLIEELIVALPHEYGALKYLCEAIYSKDVDLLGFGLEFSRDVGFIRLVVDKVDSAEEAFKMNDIKYSQNRLLALGIPHQPGAFLSLAEIYEEMEENILYCYTLLELYGDDEHEKWAVVCLQSENPLEMYEEVNKRTKEKKIKIFTKEMINQFGK